jgi:VanZ family protein
MQERSTTFKRLRYWLPAIFVAILISIFSTHYFSDEQTGRIIIPTFHWLLPWATPRMLRLIHIGIRKLAHITEFGVFSVTVFHGVRAERAGWRVNWALATLVIATSYAGLDEWHQSFVVLRHASPRDVAIDTFGALLAQFIVWWYATRKWPLAALSRIPPSPVKVQKGLSS